MAPKLFDAEVKDCIKVDDSLLAGGPKAHKGKVLRSAADGVTIQPPLTAELQALYNTWREVQSEQDEAEDELPPAPRSSGSGAGARPRKDSTHDPLSGTVAPGSRVAKRDPDYVRGLFKRKLGRCPTCRKRHMEVKWPFLCLSMSGLTDNCAV